MASIDLGANTGNSSGTGSGGGGGSSQWITSGANIYYPTGNVGIDTTNPLTPLQINNSLQLLSPQRSAVTPQVENVSFLTTSSATGTRSVVSIINQISPTGDMAGNIQMDCLEVDQFVVDSNTFSIGVLNTSFFTNYAGGSGSIGGMVAINALAKYNGTGTAASVVGFSGQGQNASSGSVSLVTGLLFILNNVGSGTVLLGNAVDARVNGGSNGGTIIQGKALRSLVSVSTGSTIVSGYGLYLETSGTGVGAISSSFGIYQVDTRPNSFAGAVGIGVSSVSAQLHTTGTVRFANFGAGAATFDANGNLSSVSDENLKEVQGKFSDGLEQLKKIDPIIYKWNEKSGLETESEYIGWSAQNLKEAVSGAVYTKKMWAWDDDSLIRAVTPGETVPDSLAKMPADLKAMAPELGFHIPVDKDGNSLPEFIPRNLPPVSDYFKQKDVHSVNDRAVLAAVVNALKSIDARLQALENK